MQTLLHCKICVLDGVHQAAFPSSPRSALPPPQSGATPQAPGTPCVAGHLPAQSPVLTANYRDSFRFPTAFSQGAVAVHTPPSTGFHLVRSETCRAQQKEALGRSRERCGGGRPVSRGPWRPGQVRVEMPGKSVDQVFRLGHKIIGPQVNETSPTFLGPKLKSCCKGPFI